MADANVKIGVDLSEAKEGLSKVPDITVEKIQEVLIRIERMVAKSARLSEKAIKESKKLTKELDKASEEAGKKWEKSADGLMELGDAVGLPTDQLEKLGRGMSALATPMGAAIAGAGAMALATIGFATAVAGAVLAADELAEELKPLRDMEGFGLSAGALASIEHANDAVATLATIGKQVVVVLGSEFAPMIDRVGTLLVKFGLMALDAFTAFADGHNVLRELAVFITTKLVKAIASPVTILMQMVWALGKVAELAGAEGMASSLLGLTKAWDGFAEGIASTAVDYWIGEADTALSGLEDSTSSYDQRAEKLIGTVAKLGDEQGKVTTKTKESTKAFDELIARLDFLIQAQKDIRGMEDFQSLFEGMGSSAKPAIDQLRSLHEQVQGMIPASAEDQLVKMNLLLMDLEAAAATAGSGNEGLADDIARLQSAIRAADPALAQLVKSTGELLHTDSSSLGALRDQLSVLKQKASESAEAMSALAPAIDQVGQKVDAVRAEKLGKLKDAFEQVAAGILTAANVIGDAVGKALSVADTLTGGALSALSLEGLINAAGSGDTAFVENAIDAGIAFVQAVAANLPSLIKQLIDGIPDLISAIVTALPPVVRALTDGIPVIIQALSDALPELIETIVDSLPRVTQTIAKAIPTVIDAVVTYLPAISRSIIDALPTIINALLESIPVLIGGLLEALPSIIRRLVKMIEEILPVLIGMIPDLIIAVVKAIPDIVSAVIDAIPAIVIALIDAIFTELLPRLPEITLEITKSLAMVIYNILAKIVGFFKDVITEIGSLGSAKTPTFGDTPGPVKAGLSGLTARFSPGDVVVAARTPEGVAAQVGASKGRSSAAPSSVRLDLTDGHIAFDRLFKSNIRSGGVLSTLAGGNTPQRNPYR